MTRQMNDDAAPLHAELALLFAVLEPSGLDATTALRLAALVRAAHRHLPLLAALELARNVAAALDDGVEDARAVIAGAIASRRVPRAGGWTWPRDLDGSTVLESMHEAWRQATA